MIILTPIAQITWRIIIWYKGSKRQPKVMIMISTKTKNKPLFKRNKLISFFVLFRLMRKIEVPARKTKIGAQKWVIHRVKKRSGKVVSRFVGSIATADGSPLCMAGL